MYKIDINSKIPLHTQLYEELKKDILYNFKAGDKLFSIRKMASIYNLSKTTIESVYSQLYAEGYIDSYPKKGFFVSDIKYKDFKVYTHKDSLNIRIKKDFLFDFTPTRLHKDTFPLKTFKRVLNKAIDELLDFGKYSDGQGEEGLRKEIVKYLEVSRGVTSHHDQVIITNGFNNSLGIAARLLQNSFQEVAIENPGYNIARNILLSYGYSVFKVPVESDGIDIDALYASKARLVYLTPSHQYPKGVTIPIANRLKLLDWADKVNGYIFEDDYDSELSYINKPIPSLQGLDDNGRVIYMGTFAKSLSPTLRLAYMVLPISLAKEFQSLFDSNFAEVSLPIQKAMELFLKEGYYDRHLRKLRTVNKRKHDLMKKCLEEYLKDTFCFESFGAGLSLIINPTLPFDMEKFKNEVQEEKINLYFASNCSGGDWEAIRLGFGGFNLDDIPNAIEALSKVWLRCLKE
jgi:GntR family transcriptional regulator/MocR family aminotransferase